MNRLENIVLRYFHYLEAKGSTYNAIVGLLWTALIGSFDILALSEIKHSFFYLLPIAFVTWFSCLRAGVLVMVVCTALWSINNVVASVFISTWNIISTLLFFTAIVVLLHKTRTMWEHEKSLSRTDPLTGAMNLRAFSEVVAYEMLRSQRDSLPFSLAYLDLDNFKNVNDTYGHAAGDALLSAIATGVIGQLRKTDVLARLGGDEFAIFFPETDQAAVEVVVKRVSRELAALMENSPCPATFSMGVLSSAGGVHDLDRMISAADALMYEVKRAGKNSVRYALYPPPAEAGRG